MIGARIRAARYACARGWRALYESPGVPLAAILTLTVCATVFVWVALVWINAAVWAEQWGVDAPVTAFVEGDAESLALEQLAEQLAAVPEVADVRVTSQEQAWKRLESAFADDAALLREVSEVAMPAILEVYLGKAADDAFTAALVAKLENHALVTEVVGTQVWVRELEDTLAVLRSCLVITGFVVALAAILVVACAMRLSALARRQELAVLRLVGATPTFIRGSFWLSGALEGMVAAALALASSWWLFAGIQAPLEGGLSWVLAGPLQFFTPGQCMLGVCVGGLLGGIGSHFATAGLLEV